MGSNSVVTYNVYYVKSDTPNNNFISFFLKLEFNNLTNFYFNHKI